MPVLTKEEFDNLLSGDPEELAVHFSSVEQDLKIAGCDALIHCHCLKTDAQGRTNIQRLAEFMRNTAADYAIPRTRREEARKRDEKYKSGSAMAKLHEEALGLFTNLSQTGEPGELLLFILAERFLKLPHVLSKMSLKTSPQMHYHGSDGIYATTDNNGTLKLYWGESKLYHHPASAIRHCLKSLSPYLIEDNHNGAKREPDILLLSDNADLGDINLSKTFQQHFDSSSSLSTNIQYCGIALVGFDVDFYTQHNTKGKLNEIVIAEANNELKKWQDIFKKRILKEKLQQYDIHILCLPFPSVEGFRSAFLKAIKKL